MAMWDFFLGKASVTKALPLFDIITLAATGVRWTAVALSPMIQPNKSMPIQSPFLYPKVSIISPELQSTVSKDYLVYSASDIIAHCIEGYFTATVQPNLINRQIEAIITTVNKIAERPKITFNTISDDVWTVNKYLKLLFNSGLMIEVLGYKKDC